MMSVIWLGRYNTPNVRSALEIGEEYLKYTEKSININKGGYFPLLLDLIDFKDIFLKEAQSVKKEEYVRSQIALGRYYECKNLLKKYSSDYITLKEKFDFHQFVHFLNMDLNKYKKECGNHFNNRDFSKGYIYLGMWFECMDLIKLCDAYFEKNR